jgi:nucleotide-binding universal stress UspA family protein
MRGRADLASRAGIASQPTDGTGAATEPEWAGDFVTVGPQPPAGDRKPIVLAIDAGIAAPAATAKAMEWSTALRAPVDVLHVQEVDVVDDDAIDRESLDDARAFVDARLHELATAGAVATGHLLRSVADHANIGRLIAGYAERVGARLIVIGEPTTGAFGRLLDHGSSQHLLAEAPCDVLVVGTEREPELLASVQ